MSSKQLPGNVMGEEHPVLSLISTGFHHFFPQPLAPGEAELDAFAERIIGQALSRSLEPSETYPRSGAACLAVVWAITQPACAPALEKLLREAIARRQTTAMRPEKQPDYIKEPYQFLDWMVSTRNDPAGGMMREIEAYRPHQSGEMRSRHLIEILVHEALTARAAKEAAKTK